MLCDIEFLDYLENLSADEWVKDETSYRNKLKDIPDFTIKVPLVNSNALHYLRDGQLVRFRGMIQDMHNPEFYLETFETLNKITNQVTRKSGKYRDTSDVLDEESLLATSPNLKSGQRQTMVVISIPGLNEWAQKIETERNDLNLLVNQPSTSQNSNTNTNLKRSLDEDEVMPERKMVIAESLDKPRKERRKSNIPVESANRFTLSTEHILNFPLPDVSSKSSIIKVYDDFDQLKLNEVIEVIGFLSVDPVLNGEFGSGKTAVDMEDDNMDPETLTHNPPPSLVPRIHAIHIRRLHHCNPLVNGSFGDNWMEARDKLKLAFSELLLGDNLAAEYLICHLISSVYLRKDVLTLGQFPLNLSNIPCDKYPHYTTELYNIVKELTTKSYYLPLTLENMNTLTFTPKKDYDCNRLTSGILQLSKNTHLVLDETKMETGQLESHGLRNLAALGSAIKTQKVKYDFKFYEIEFDCDIPILILSEGKSLLPSDVHVPIVIDESRLKIFNEIVEAAQHYLKPDVLNAIRVFITKMQLIEYSIKEEYQFVQDDFIAMRRESEDGQGISADDLHRLLVLARLVSISRGHNTLEKECWDMAKQMEEQRIKRIPKTARSTPSSL